MAEQAVLRTKNNLQFKESIPGKRRQEVEDVVIGSVYGRLIAADTNPSPL
jgi:hypothetical protein